MLREKIKTEALKHGFQKKDRTINVYELAKQSGLQRKQLGDYLKGKTDFGGRNIEKLLKLFKINIWQYPEKNEYPLKGEVVLCKIHVISHSGDKFRNIILCRFNGKSFSCTQELTYVKSWQRFFYCV